MQIDIAHVKEFAGWSRTLHFVDCILVLSDAEKAAAERLRAEPVFSAQAKASVVSRVPWQSIIGRFIIMIGSVAAVAGHALMRASGPHTLLITGLAIVALGLLVLTLHAVWRRLNERLIAPDQPLTLEDVVRLQRITLRAEDAESARRFERDLRTSLMRVQTLLREGSASRAGL